MPVQQEEWVRGRSLDQAGGNTRCGHQVLGEVKTVAAAAEKGGTERSQMNPGVKDIVGIVGGESVMGETLDERLLAEHAAVRGYAMRYAVDTEKLRAARKALFAG